MPILIAVVVLAAISIGVVLYRQRKSGGQGPDRQRLLAQRELDRNPPMEGSMLQVSRKTRALTAALVAVVALGVFAASAAALPAKFFGVVPQSSLTQEQFNTLKKGGVKIDADRR